MFLQAIQVLINVKVLNSSNPKLQFKDTKSATKSKLIDIFSQLKGFKFATTLVLVFKQMEREDKTQSMTIFI